VQVVGDGLVWVTMMAPDAKRWAALARSPTDSTTRARAVRNYGELIDTEAGVVLARAGALDADAAQRTLAWGWFPGPMLGYRPIELPNGASGFRVLEAKLRAKR